VGETIALSAGVFLYDCAFSPVSLTKILFLLSSLKKLKSFMLKKALTQRISSKYE
jgi:hypothetical protein